MKDQIYQLQNLNNISGIAYGKNVLFNSPRQQQFSRFLSQPNNYNRIQTSLNTIQSFNQMELELPRQWEQDEEYQYEPYPEMRLVLQKDIQYDTNLLIIAEHGPASLYTHSLIGPQTPINHLNFSKAKQCSIADLYEQNNRQTLLLIFNDNLEPMKDVLFSKFLQKYFKTKRVILLSSVSKNTLKDKNLPPLTYISTSVAQNINLPRFDQGFTGIAADILAWGEMNRISVIAFIATLGEYELTCNVVQQIFGALRGRYGFEGSFDIAEQVKKYNMKNYSNKMFM